MSRERRGWMSDLHEIGETTRRGDREPPHDARGFMRSARNCIIGKGCLKTDREREEEMITLDRD